MLESPAECVGIRTVIEPFEAEQFALQPAIESTALELMKVNPELAVKFLTNYTNGRCNLAVEKFWDLAELLIVKYDDKGF